MKGKNSTIDTTEFLAGRLVLDFINTVEFRERETGVPVNDFIKSADDLKIFYNKAAIKAVVGFFRYE